jgi:hypothetical protein
MDMVASVDVAHGKSNHRVVFADWLAARNALCGHLVACRHLGAQTDNSAADIDLLSKRELASGDQHIVGFVQPN